MTHLVYWGVNSCDYKCLRYILREGGRPDLLPAHQTSPYFLWSRLRNRLELTAADLSLQLSRLFWVIYTECRELIAEAHTADADVEMLFRLTWAYLLMVLDMSLPGKFNGPSSFRWSDKQKEVMLQQLERAKVSKVPDNVGATLNETDARKFEEQVFLDDLDGLKIMTSTTRRMRKPLTTRRTTRMTASTTRRTRKRRARRTVRRRARRAVRRRARRMMAIMSQTEKEEKQDEDGVKRHVVALDVIHVVVMKCNTMEYHEHAAAYHEAR